jgi:hypothetical protein
VNCEKEMREKNEMGEGGCRCVVREKKKKRKAGGTWVVGKKKGNKKEKINGEWGLSVWWEKRGVEKKEGKKKIEREKTKLVLFIYSLCLVQSVEL